MRAIVISFLIVAFAGLLLAQSQKTVIVPAASPVAASMQAPAAPTNSAAIQGALKTLQEMKATNEDTLRKQAATLEQLDALEKAADQLKIYTKRG